LIQEDMDVPKRHPDSQNVSPLCSRNVGCGGGYDNVLDVQEDDSHMDLANFEVQKSYRDWSFANRRSLDEPKSDEGYYEGS
jgi:hypothetical protein